MFDPPSNSKSCQEKRTEEKRFLPPADTLVYTMLPKSGLLGQAADATSPIMESSYFCFLTSSECSQWCRIKWVSNTLKDLNDSTFCKHHSCIVLQEGLVKLC